MAHELPPYSPPLQRRAGIAAAGAPLLVLLGFTGLVLKLLEPSTVLALFAACTVWVVHEMHGFQASTDRYNRHYAERHLRWRSSEALLALADAPGTPEPTRVFVTRFVHADRQLLRDGQLP
jgi:hypothetical protein